MTDKLFSMWINQIYGNKSIFYRRNLVFQKGAQKQRDHTKKSNSYKTYFLSEVGKENMYKYTALRDKCRIFVLGRSGTRSNSSIIHNDLILSFMTQYCRVMLRLLVTVLSAFP